MSSTCRELVLLVGEECLDRRGLLPTQLSSLTQLTRLEFGGGLPSAAIRSILPLPRLADLTLEIKERAGQRDLAAPDSSLNPSISPA